MWLLFKSASHLRLEEIVRHDDSVRAERGAVQVVVHGVAKGLLIVRGLFAGYRLLGVNIAYPIAAQMIVAVGGIYALFRQFGVFR